MGCVFGKTHRRITNSFSLEAEERHKILQVILDSMHVQRLGLGFATSLRGIYRVTQRQANQKMGSVVEAHMLLMFVWFWCIVCDFV